MMSEGNPGALNALVLAYKECEAHPTAFFKLIMSLDDMNMRGCQIHVAFKDYAENDVAKFIADVTGRSEKMVEAVNRECVFKSSYGEYLHLAVTGGASWERPVANGDHLVKYKALRSGDVNESVPAEAQATRSKRIEQFMSATELGQAALDLARHRSIENDFPG